MLEVVKDSVRKVGLLVLRRKQRLSQMQVAKAASKLKFGTD